MKLISFMVTCIALIIASSCKEGKGGSVVPVSKKGDASDRLSEQLHQMIGQSRTELEEKLHVVRHWRHGERNGFSYENYQCEGVNLWVTYRLDNEGNSDRDILRVVRKIEILE